MTDEETDRIADLTRKLAYTAIDYKKRCEELEANLADGSFYQEKDIDAWQNRIEELEAKLAAERERIADLERRLKFWMRRILGPAMVVAGPSAKGESDA